MTVTNVSELNTLVDVKTAVALGSFDALHKGHVEVISAAVEYARENGLLSVVQLLDIPNTRQINDGAKRFEVLDSLGVDMVLRERFTPEFKRIRYDEFVLEYLVKKYNAAAVFVGENYRFGYMAEGNTERLAELCERLGIKVFVKECLALESVISSTEIRRFIIEGKMEKVIEYMGRPFSVRGEVVHGKALGRTLGFPTANIEFPEGRVVPQSGVYATRILVDGNAYMGITNVGAKPTVGDECPNIESYLLDFEDNLYGKEIDVAFLKRLRDIKRFDSLETLKAQLEEDKDKVKGTRA